MKITHYEDSAIIQPIGSLDINTSDELSKAVIEAFESGAKSLLIDCQAVTFLDSSGLSVMVMALKKARELHVKLALCSINEQAMMLFKLTGMNKVFNILEDSAAFRPILANAQ